MKWTPYRSSHLRVFFLCVIFVELVAALALIFTVDGRWASFALDIELITVITAVVVNHYESRLWRRKLREGAFRAADYKTPDLERRLFRGENGRWWVVADKLDFGSATVPTHPLLASTPYSAHRTQRRARKAAQELTESGAFRLFTEFGEPTPVKLVWSVVDSKQQPATTRRKQK